MRKFAFVITLAAVLVSSSACGYLNRQIPNLGLPEYDMSSTEVGVTTGAVVGGGVGVVIGSLGGNAGEGLVIGALTGATAGGIVGNEIDNREAGQAAKDEELLKQREEIKQQRQEIEELRFQSGDIASRSPEPTLPGSSLHGSSSGNEPIKLGGIKENDILPEALGPMPNEASAGLPKAKEIDIHAVALEPGEEAISTPEITMAGEGGPKPASQLPQAVVPESVQPSNQQDMRASLAQPKSDAELESILAKVPVRERRAEAEPISGTTNNQMPELKTSKAEEPSRNELDNDVPYLASSLDPIPEKKPLRLQDSLAKEKSKKKEIIVAKSSATLEEKVIKEASELESDVEEEVEEVKETVVEVEKEDSKPAKTVQALNKSSEGTSNSSECQEAELEVERARDSASDADKLFYYRRALRLCPDSSTYHFEIGQVYAAIGRTEDAEFEFKQAIELNPDNKAAEKQLKLVQNAMDDN